ncbi:unnamed protein product [Polarella glacialis]|uniref:Protein kinase domain-containing protein n=1 Tax=Polarella glacialis TaxID=89957 RepID=A0A813DDX4_POLGL|nr:unnamed protein product [Polarella glacialis]
MSKIVIVTVVHHHGDQEVDAGQRYLEPQDDQPHELQLCQHLGKGAYSDVFSVGSAAVKNADCQLAAKVFNRSPTDPGEEAKMLAMVAGSDHVIRLCGHFVVTGFSPKGPTSLLLMEQCEMSFRDELKRTGPASEHRAAVVLAGLLAALEHVHSRGVLHRDVKPENILFAVKDGRVQLSDFGMAVKTSDNNIHWSCGTPGYVAPEVISRREGSYKMDIFAAGVVLYVALTMQNPFNSSNNNDNNNNNWKFATLNLEADTSFLASWLVDGGFRCCLLAQLLWLAKARDSNHRSQQHNNKTTSKQQTNHNKL